MTTNELPNNRDQRWNLFAFAWCVTAIDFVCAMVMWLMVHLGGEVFAIGFLLGSLAIPASPVLLPFLRRFRSFAETPPLTTALVVAWLWGLTVLNILFASAVFGVYLRR